MEREKERSALNQAPYRRASWDIKGRTSGAFCSVVFLECLFKARAALSTVLLCLEKLQCFWAEVFPGTVQ